MRILQLDLGREWRGGQRQVLYLARALHGAEGFATLVAAPKGSPLAQRAAAEGLPGVALPGRSPLDPRSILVLRSLVRREGIDIIHTHCARSATLGAVLKRLTGAKLVHSRRVSYPVKQGLSLAKYRVADAVAAVSAEIAETLAMNGVARERLRVIHSGIDPDLYAAAAAARRPEPPVLAVIGAMTPQKGHVVFLQALARLAAEGGQWSALVVGDGPLRSELEAAAGSLGLAGRVAFTGFRDSAEVLGGISVLAVPSVDGEGSSGTIKEAWAANVPVVCSDLPSNLELVEPGKNGLSFRSRDAGALAGHLGALLRDADLRARLAEGGRERLASFTHKAMSREVMALYRDLIPVS
ncbi:glycosyltransferase [Desulfocurvus sp. DL9XJH121]